MPVWPDVAPSPSLAPPHDRIGQHADFMRLEQHVACKCHRKVSCRLFGLTGRPRRGRCSEPSGEDVVLGGDL